MSQKYLLLQGEGVGTSFRFISLQAAFIKMGGTGIGWRRRREGFSSVSPSPVSRLLLQFPVSSRPRPRCRHLRSLGAQSFLVRLPSSPLFAVSVVYSAAFRLVVEARRLLSKKMSLQNSPFFFFHTNAFSRAPRTKRGAGGFKRGRGDQRKEGERGKGFWGGEALRDPLGLIANESPLSFSPPAKKLSMNRL